MSESDFHRAYGRHSNIPACCIEFFLSGWDHRSTYGKMIYGTAWNYVPCPGCFATDNKKQLRLCDSECGSDCATAYRQKYWRKDA